MLPRCRYSELFLYIYLLLLFFLVLGGAVGRHHSPTATAEIEENEVEVISIDTPTFPQHDINELLQEVTPIPEEMFQVGSSKLSLVQFNPYFMCVWEENSDTYSANISDVHVKELLQDYQQKNNISTELETADNEFGAENRENLEKYEKANPAHGDKMFHRFLSKIQINPGQVLRYSFLFNINNFQTLLTFLGIRENPFHYCYILWKMD